MMIRLWPRARLIVAAAVILLVITYLASGQSRSISFVEGYRTDIKEYGLPLVVFSEAKSLEPNGDIILSDSSLEVENILINFIIWLGISAAGLSIIKLWLEFIRR
ncbi:MAG TPA: hypothetical protein VGA08_02960 [Candidatus Saccharimonadales bacterium]